MKPDIIVNKANTELELIISEHSFTSNLSEEPTLRNHKNEFFIGASRECRYDIYVEVPTRITVIGGYKNNYTINGPPEVLEKTRFRYFGRIENYFPTGIHPDNIQMISGIFE